MAGKIEAFVLECGAEKTLELFWSSQQIPDPKTWYGIHKLVPPPYDAKLLGELPDKCSWHKICCQRIASDTAGLGYTVRPIVQEKEGEEAVVPDEILSFLQKPNDEISLRQTLLAAQFDFESIGWLAFEIVRRKNGKPFQLWHVPAQTIRRHKDKKTICQIRDTKKTWFKQFGADIGEGKVVHKITGEIIDESDVPLDKRGNEIFFLRNYTSSNSYYGVPDIIPALGSVNLLIAVSNFRLDFFDNNAIPAWAVIVEGGELGQEARDKIEAHLKELKGTKGAHSTLLISTDDEAIKVKFQRLQTEVREGSFSKLKREERDEVIFAHGVPPHRIGIFEVGAMGGNIAIEATRVYKNSVISPRQEDLEDFLNKLLADFTEGKQEWKFKFAEIDLTDEILDVRLSRMLVEIGALTPNDVIRRLGLGPIFDGGDLRLISKQLTKLVEEGKAGFLGKKDPKEEKQKWKDGEPREEKDLVDNEEDPDESDQ